MVFVSQPRASNTPLQLQSDTLWTFLLCKLSLETNTRTATVIHIWIIYGYVGYTCAHVVLANLHSHVMVMLVHGRKRLRLVALPHLPRSRPHPVLRFGGWEGEVVPGVRLRGDGVRLGTGRGRLLLIRTTEQFNADYKLGFEDAAMIQMAPQAETQHFL